MWMMKIYVWYKSHELLLVGIMITLGMIFINYYVLYNIYFYIMNPLMNLRKCFISVNL